MSTAVAAKETSSEPAQPNPEMAFPETELIVLDTRPWNRQSGARFHEGDRP
jgi:hypothetical protein